MMGFIGPGSKRLALTIYLTSLRFNCVVNNRGIVAFCKG